ncbi:Conserved_hypothetical protein [Hexamita inflata]|uniref:Uncharacterized protein n=1 Tax=Hexamita inflata TaxID=28002 RepID=A0AA86R970_9EUKA|nr:Conserved hypothetical protein [Hexamita inflata]
MNLQLKNLQQKFDQLELKYQAQLQKFTQQTQQCGELQHQLDIQSRKLHFDTKVQLQQKQEIESLQAQIAPLKQKAQKLETQLFTTSKQNGVYAMAQRQINLEQELQQSQVKLQEQLKQNADLRREIKITSEALVLKESSFYNTESTIPVHEQIRGSLLRTISALKSECDVFEKLHSESQVKIQQLSELNRKLENENLSLIQQVQITEEKFTISAEENILVKNIQLELENERQKSEVLTSRLKIASNINNELQNTIKQRADYQQIVQLNNQLKQELRNREDEIENIKNEMVNIQQNQYNKANEEIIKQADEFQRLNQTVVQMHQEIEQLKGDKQRLQKVLCTMAKRQGGGINTQEIYG